MPLRIIFMGTPDFSVPTLRALNTVNIARGFEVGLAIVLIAIILDRFFRVRDVAFVTPGLRLARLECLAKPGACGDRRPHVRRHGSFGDNPRRRVPAVHHEPPVQVP
jgi:hypothetical protein